MNKRGSGIIGDMLIGIIFVFILAFMIVTSVFFHKTITEETDIYSRTEMGQEIQGHVDATVRIFNFIFIMSIASILVTLVISAHYIQTSPVFLVVGIVIIAIVVTISAPLSNSFSEFTEQDDISDKLGEHQTVLILMDNFPLINLVIGSLFLIVLYAKKRGGETEGQLPIYQT